MRNFIMGAMGMMGTMGMMSKRTEGQQHCCWESLRDYSFVKLKLQPSQTELLFRSVADSFFLDHATQLLGIPAGLLLCEAKASAVANRAPIPLGG